MHLLFSKVLAITYHHKTSVHASQMNWCLWRDVITFDKNSNKLFIPSAKQGFQNVIQSSIRIFDPHTSGIFFNTRRVALNTGVNKSYLHRQHWITWRKGWASNVLISRFPRVSLMRTTGNWGLRNLRNLTKITYFDWKMFYTAVSMMVSKTIDTSDNSWVDL